MAEDAGSAGRSPGPRAGGPTVRVSVTAGVSMDANVYVISVAAELAGMHPQTLRQYDRLGLVQPSRATGGGRRYSQRDVSLLQEISRLSQDEGVNLAGIKRIIELESQVDALQSKVDDLSSALAKAEQRVAEAASAVHASYRRDLVPVKDHNSVVLWRDR